MPPSKSSKRGNPNLGPSQAFTPALDAQTFRDLLIFEERLKQNAARLQSRKKKYESLLAVFVGFTIFLGYHVLIDRKQYLPLHYFILALLLICLTTLFLFFASGMHAERIRAANKFVPQSNRALRSFNMYLNTRTAPRSPFLSFLGYKSESRSDTLRTSSPHHSQGAPPSPSGALKRSAIPPIPPSQNPRGELIFSTKVSPEFREGYERYRAAFERRRAEKMAAKRAQSWRKWLDWRPWRAQHQTRHDPDARMSSVDLDRSNSRPEESSKPSAHLRSNEVPDVPASLSRRKRAPGSARKAARQRKQSSASSQSETDEGGSRQISPLNASEGQMPFEEHDMINQDHQDAAETEQLLQSHGSAPGASSGAEWIQVGKSGKLWPS